MKARLTALLIVLYAMSAASAQKAAPAQNTTAQCPLQQCDQTPQMTFIMLSVIAVMAIVYTYRLTQSKDGLESQVKRNREILIKQRAEIQANEEQIKMYRERLSEKQTQKIQEEMKKSQTATGGGRLQKDTLRKEYWDKIGKITEAEETPSKKTELDALRARQTEIKGLVEIAKSKYYQRVIDELSFNEITRDYQKQLIEIESKIDKITKKGPPDDANNSAGDT